MSTDPPEPTASDDAETRVEDETLLWDERLPPIWSSDGRYGLLHRDLIWDRLGSYETGSRPTGVADPDEHFLLATIPANDADGLVTDDMDFDAIDPAFVESMGLQPVQSDDRVPAEVTTAKAGSRPISPVVVENRPTADDDRWWWHPDDDRSDIE